jgi:GDP-L-fucose synthase
MEKDSKIYIAGHSGLVGRALYGKLLRQGYSNLLCASSSELDLRNQSAVNSFFEKQKPDYVFLAAAKVGGINANMSYPADFIYDNLQIQNNVIHSSFKNNVKKLLFLGSGCMYPKEAGQPIKEEYLLTGKLEPTNEPYAIAKLAGLSLCQSYNKQHGTNFICGIPINLYGEGDNFDPKNSHLMAALIKRFHEAKISDDKNVVLWGSGKPRREVLYSGDLADALILLMNKYNSSEAINIGSGIDYSIKELSDIVSGVIGYKGEINFDTAKPDGMMKRLLDSSKINQLGWMAKTSLEDGIRNTYSWYVCKDMTKK